MPTYTYEKDIRDLPLQPKAEIGREPWGDEDRRTGEELDARDRQVAASYNRGAGRVTGTADAAELYDHYSD
jgi:hypothetical protein